MEHIVLLLLVFLQKQLYYGNTHPTFLPPYIVKSFFLENQGFF